MRKEYFLAPIYDSRKSFYGKAKVTEVESGNTKIDTVISYDTPVLRVTYDNNKVTFTKLWQGYSATTMRHINEYLSQHGFNFGGKAWWDAL